MGSIGSSAGSALALFHTRIEHGTIREEVCARLKYVPHLSRNRVTLGKHFVCKLGLELVT